jgi:hypothetical protein
MVSIHSQSSTLAALENCAQPLAPILLLKKPEFFVTVLEDRDALRERSEDIYSLAADAIENNVFYEPAVLMASLSTFGKNSKFAFALIYRKHPGSGSTPQLCGFFPLVLGKYRGLPVCCASLWNFMHYNSCTPLVRRGAERDALKAFFKWARSQQHRFSLLELNYLPGSGEFSASIATALRELETPHRVLEVFSRAFLRRKKDAETYFHEAVPGIKRKEYRRLERRLAEKGRLEYSEAASKDELSGRIEEFLRLEASGWKGKAGTALACTPETKKYFEDAATALFARGQLQLVTTYLAGRPIAAKCNFLSGSGGAAVRIAFDEEFRRYSPGLLLELENIRRIHDATRTQWMDSCATADHFMANRLWTERKVLQSVVVATGGKWSQVLIAILPLLRGIKRICGPAFRTRELVLRRNRDE